jgi:hypothetical protein
VVIGRKRSARKQHSPTQAAQQIDATMRDNAAAGDRAFEVALDEWKARQEVGAERDRTEAPAK